MFSPLQAIKAKCTDCCRDNSIGMNECPSTKCPLYPFCFGKNSLKEARNLSEEQRSAKREVLAKDRKNKKGRSKNDKY